MAGMFDDPEAGLLLGSRGDTVVSDPQAEAYLKLAADFTPGFSDAMSAKDAYEAIMAGNYGEAALAGLGILPFIPNITRLIKPAKEGFDIRYLTRKGDEPRAQVLTTKVEERANAPTPTVKLEEFEGRPFLTQYSDRTAAGGTLVDVNGVPVRVNLQGGQGFMFENPGQVWAADRTPASKILEVAEKLKQKYKTDPIWMPWTMAPTGGDHATMTGEVMLGYAAAAMDKKTKGELNKAIKAFIPDWKGVENPASLEQFRSISGKKRKEIQKVMDDDFRNKGGLSLSEARLAVSDATQLSKARTELKNVGEIFANKPLIDKSGHATYNTGIPGQGLGTLDESIMAYETLPVWAKLKNVTDPRNPPLGAMRSLETNLTAGFIDDKVLRGIENLRNTGLENPLLK